MEAEITAPSFKSYDQFKEIAGELLSVFEDFKVESIALQGAVDVFVPVCVTTAEKRHPAQRQSICLTISLKPS